MGELSHSRLLEVLDYNQDTGVFTWKKSYHRRFIGKEAGCTYSSGYHYVAVDGVGYRAHRLAWFYVHGTWPRYEVDHINGNRLDNRISNLRDVTRRQNSQNRVEHRNGQLVGSQFYKPYNCWRAAIQIDGRVKHLGYFPTELEAHQVYLEACTRLAGLGAN